MPWINRLSGYSPETSEQELNEIYEIRRLLEPESIAKTVANITEREVAVARELIARMESESDPGTWTVLNNRFHGILAEAARSPLLASVVQNLRNRAAGERAHRLAHQHHDGRRVRAEAPFGKIKCQSWWATTCWRRAF